MTTTVDPHTFRVRWCGQELTVSGADPALWLGLDGGRDPIRLDRFRVEAVGAGAAGTEPAVRHVPDGEPHITRAGDQVVVHGPADFWLRNERIGCVVVQAWDRNFLRAGRIVVHGAVVDLDGEGVLLTGPSDSGKTSVALELCTAHGGRMMANDHAVVDLTGPRPVVLPGEDNTFAFRSQAMWLSDRELYRELYGEPDDLRPHERRRTRPEELGIEVGTSAVPLRRIYFVGVGTTVHPVRYPSPRTRSWIRLYADITGRVRASTMLLFDDDGRIGPALPDLADPTTTVAVARRLSPVLDSGIVHDLRGTPEWCARAVVDDLRADRHPRAAGRSTT
ncbi:hypothetical protein [Umezawaea sp.]|uniref:hypothetical protein n=1 Tax=Umezawaea sp. TaxID=1955258 RepID=UPI002ED3EF61